MLHNHIPSWQRGTQTTMMSWRTAQHVARKRAKVRGIRQRVAMGYHRGFRRVFIISDAPQAEPCS